MSYEPDFNLTSSFSSLNFSVNFLSEPQPIDFQIQQILDTL